jgi:N-glycosylase/DNA lyase
MAYITSIDFFDPHKIADSGQAFRIHSIDDSHTELIAFGKYLQIADMGDKRFAFSCTEKEFNNIWKKYFDLDTDYVKTVNMIAPEDTYLKDAAAYGYGIRILNQDIFEAVISYIISQRRSIPSITTCVDRISERYGHRIRMPELESPFVTPLKDKYFSFPAPEDLKKATAEEINELGAGYRTPYILSAVNDFMSGKLDPDALIRLNDNELYEALISMYGVGVKVANCVMLFAFHRTGRFPVDVWVQRIQDKYYNGSFDCSLYPETAGIMQQFMFYYERLEDSHK